MCAPARFGPAQAGTRVVYIKNTTQVHERHIFFSSLYASSRWDTYSAYPVAHGNLLVSFRMRMGRAMWSAEHSISSTDSPRNSGLMYGNFSGISEPGLPPPPELLPAIIPPMNPATADLTRVSMLAPRRGGVSVDRCAAPRLPFTGLPPSSTKDSTENKRRRRGEEDEEPLGWLRLHVFGADNNIHVQMEQRGCCRCTSTDSH